MNKSINRAIALLKTPANYSDYLIFKMLPINGGCCCFHCWPEAWNAVNEHIKPYGRLKDEGDILLGQGDNKFVLECHESGAEIIVYLGVTTASLVLVKSIIDLTTTLLKSLQNERKKVPQGIRLIKRRVIRGDEIEEEELLEVEFPLEKKTIQELNDKITKVLEK